MISKNNILGIKPAKTSEYQIGFLLGKISCQNCKKDYLPDGINTFLSLEDLFETAKGAHNSAVFVNRVLCATPKLVVFYATTLIDKSLVASVVKMPDTGKEM